MVPAAPHGYRVGMAAAKGPQHPAKPPYGADQPAQRAESLGGQAASAARAAAAFYRGWKGGRSQVDPLAVERERQQAKHQSAVANYRSRLGRLRVRLVAGGSAVIGGAAVAASALDGMPAEAPLAVLGASAAIIGAQQALKSRRALNQLEEPKPPPAIVAAPLALPPGSAGADPAARVTGVRMHLMELLPTVENLHAEAADQIRAVDAATAPGLNALVERIRSMQRIIATMPGSPAAQSAQLTISALVIRLSEGANAYQDLLAAVIALSSAPEITGPPAATLLPAIEDMQAYAAGLQRAAQTWD